MKCPFCGQVEDKVVDSRESKEGEVIRRRRECLHCGKRFTSYERIDQIPHLIIKKDGRRERFDRAEVVAGLLKACVTGFVIAGIGCTEGLRAHGGALGVGRSVRRAVIASIVLILIISYDLTWLTYRAFET